MMLFLVLLLVTSAWAPSTAAQAQDLERAGATRILPASDADTAALLNSEKRATKASDECVSPKNTLMFDHVYKNQETERIPWNAGKGDTDFRAALREYWRTKKLKMKMFKRKTKVKVLEVGCGQANDIKLVSMMGYTPTCVELSSTAVEAGKALKIPRASFVLGNVCTLQQMNQTYDIICKNSNKKPDRTPLNIRRPCFLLLPSMLPPSSNTHACARARSTHAVRTHLKNTHAHKHTPSHEDMPNALAGVVRLLLSPNCAECSKRNG